LKTYLETTFVVKIIVSALGQNHLGLYNLRHLRQLLPPGTAEEDIKVVFEVPAGTDRLEHGPEAVGGEISNMFAGVEPATDTISAESIRELGVTVRSGSGICH
jgi:hypothetical protein